MHLPFTWFKCIADMIISCNKQRPLLSSPPFTHHFLPVSSELTTIWDRPVLFGQWWRMWFQQALNLTHIFSVTTLAKPQVFFHRDWRKVWVELWELKCLNHWPFVKPEPQLRSKRKILMLIKKTLTVSTLPDILVSCNKLNKSRPFFRSCNTQWFCSYSECIFKSKVQKHFKIDL